MHPHLYVVLNTFASLATHRLASSMDAWMLKLRPQLHHVSHHTRLYSKFLLIL